ncbi:putative Glucoside xylosyltransferase 2 [Hypsibius exemplaris]|uniref:Glucoside xylosyltransferase 2 n=1 Tax=Hypsibius exemplaris TaxID=2072580 RepID=A0A9X6NDD5_HYPEX|nr:putative Glucoside xylosyltransferase 2 [Hypsibius exemplaris]
MSKPALGRLEVYIICLCLLTVWTFLFPQLFSSTVTVFYYHVSSSLIVKSPNQAETPRQSPIEIVLPGCADRLPDAMNLVKSIFLASEPKNHVTVYLFTELVNWNRTEREFRKLTSSLAFIEKYLTLRLLDPALKSLDHQKLPKNRTGTEACGPDLTAFLPVILPNSQGAIVLEPNALMLGSVQELWSQFSKMNSKQVIGVALQRELASFGWYNSWSRRAFAPPFEIHPGVILMNLTRLRNEGFTEALLKIQSGATNQTQLLPSTALNQYFYLNPDKLFLLPCKWNLREDHCGEESKKCKSAEEDGAGIIQLPHNSSGLPDKRTVTQKDFYSVSDYIENFDPTDPKTMIRLMDPLMASLNNKTLPTSNLCRASLLRGLERQRTQKN